MNAVSLASSIRAEEVRQFHARSDIRNKVVEKSATHLRRVRRYVGGYDALPHVEVRQHVETAVKLGYYRALAYRFLTEAQQVNPRQWLKIRRLDGDTPAKHSKDRSRDLDIVQADFPAFAGFIPTTPITSQEVVKAAQEEIHDIHCAPGSDYQQARLYGATKTFTQGTSSGPAMGVRFQGTDQSEGLERLRSGTVTLTSTHSSMQTSFVEFGTLETLPNAPTVEPSPFQNSGDEVFSSVILRIAAHLQTTFGLVPTMYWVWDKMFFHGDYAHLLRVFGGDVLEAEDKTAFDTIKRDIGRKLKVMDEALEDLVTDLDLQRAYNAL